MTSRIKLSGAKADVPTSALLSFAAVRFIDLVPERMQHCRGRGR